MSNWRVRRAVSSDFMWLSEQCAAFISFIGFLPYNKPHVDAMLGAFARQHYVLVAERDGERVGVAVAMVQRHPLNPDVKMLTEIMWWVPEEHRGTRAGIILLNALEKVAEHERVDLFVMSTEAQSALSGRMLLKRGFNPQETTWIKKCQPQQH